MEARIVQIRKTAISEPARYIRYSSILYIFTHLYIRSFIYNHLDIFYIRKRACVLLQRIQYFLNVCMSYIYTYTYTYMFIILNH